LGLIGRHPGNSVRTPADQAARPSRMESDMKKLLVAGIVLASFGFAATADAHRDDWQIKDWQDTLHTVPPPDVMQRNMRHEMAGQPVTEGRNAAVAVPHKAVKGHSTH
jgi:hypothetical protein